MNPYESPQLDPFDNGEEIVLAEVQQTGEKLGLLYGSFFILGLVIAAWFNPELQQAIAGRYLWFGLWPSLTNILQDAFGLAALALLVVRKIQGATTFPRHFGHWFLLMHATSFLSDTIYVGIYNYWLRGQWEDSDIEMLSANVVASLTPLLVALVLAVMSVAGLAIRYSPGERLWQRYTLFNIAIHAWHLVATLQGSAHTFSSSGWGLASFNTLLVGLSVLSYLLAVARDWRLAEEKDQLHWVGVGCQAAFLAVLIWSIYVGATQSYSFGV